MKQRIDNDWKFYAGDAEPKTDTAGWGGAKAKAFNFGVTAKNYQDEMWKNVSVPHDYVHEGDYTQKWKSDTGMNGIPEMESIDSRHFAGGSLEGSIGWYRKHFFLEKDMGDLEKRRIYLHFDGVYRNCTVYLNEYYVGSHKNGYTSFYFDITDFLLKDEENLLAVRVDATGREGWWYEGGGIYRHVWLESVPLVHICPDEVHVWTEFGEEVAVYAEYHLCSRALTKKEVQLTAQLCDADGYIINTDEETIEILPWDDSMVRKKFVIQYPNLWDIENPYLYKIKTIIDTDVTETFFGVRKIHFDEEKGFFLNGRQTKIKGVCMHQDHSGVGIGVPDGLLEYRISCVKEMGANAIRTAHSQQSRELLTVCDRLGMMVFTETRRMSSAADDVEELKRLVIRDRNHPSVILWGIGNEEVFCQHLHETKRMTQTLKMTIRKLDTTRPVTSAVVCWDGEKRYKTAERYVEITQELDVMGFNYTDTAWDDYHRRCPKQPILITEASTNSSTRDCYETNEALGQYYIMDAENETKCKSGIKAVKKDVAETQWKKCAEREYLSGIFLWTGFDYKGEPTPTAYPAVNSQFGILDSCGFRKDNFYYYQSWWTAEDVLYIFPHWTHPGDENQKKNVYCYSNMDEVELSVNGKSYGKQKVEKNWYNCFENVIYEPGRLQAAGYRNGIKICEKVIDTVSDAVSIKAEAFSPKLTQYADTLILNVELMDKNGRVAVLADDVIRIQVSGGGTFLGTGNGNPASHEPDIYPARRAFHGRMQVLIKIERPDEPIIVKLRTDKTGELVWEKQIALFTGN